MLFRSATYPKEISEQITDFIEEAQTISLTKEKLKLDNVKQFYVKCEPGKKLDFVESIYDLVKRT